MAKGWGNSISTSSFNLVFSSPFAFSSLSTSSLGQRCVTIMLTHPITGNQRVWKPSPTCNPFCITLLQPNPSANLTVKSMSQRFSMSSPHPATERPQKAGFALSEMHRATE